MAPGTAHRPNVSPPALRKLAWGVLAYNLFVIAWGAYVRASGSGAGCGRHWPLCNGEVVPRAQSMATIIEATHRATSGIALILVVALMVWTLRVMPRGHRSRGAAILSTVFVLGEALIGAALVLFELVAHDASMKRGFSMILHLGNTFFLLAALTVTAWTLTVDRGGEGMRYGVAGSSARRNAGDGDEEGDDQESELLAARGSASGDGAAHAGIPVRALLALSLSAVLLLGSSGAIAALGDTLFPAKTLQEGIAQDLSPVAHAFLRLRLFHPVIALVTGALVFMTSSAVRLSSRSARTRKLALVTTILFAIQFTVGLVNMTLLAPIAMQIVHLLLADATWIALVLMAWEATRTRTAQRPIMSRNGPAPTSDVPPSTTSVDPVT